MIVAHLFSDVDRSESTYTGQLIAKVTVERLKPVGQFDGGFAARVQPHRPVINVHHVRGFDERVIQVFIGWVEWMVYFERAGAFGEISGDFNIAVKTSGRSVRKADAC